MNNKKTSDTLKFLMNFDLVVCSYCYKIVPNGNYCERCGKKLIPVQELDDSLRANINKDLSTKLKRRTNMNELERKIKALGQIYNLNQLSKEDFISAICTYIQAYADYNDIDKEIIATYIFSIMHLSQSEIRRMVEEEG